MISIVEAGWQSLGALLVGTCAVMTVTAVRAVMPVVVMSTAAEVDVRGSVVLTLLGRRKSHMRMGNRRRLTGE